MTPPQGDCTGRADVFLSMHEPLIKSKFAPREVYLDAIAICDDCPVKDACLEFAIETDERRWVWGGKTPAEREKIRRERGMTRLPANFALNHGPSKNHAPNNQWRRAGSEG